MYSDNSAIGYCAIIDYSVSEFGKVVLHESGGHAFANFWMSIPPPKGAITEESRDSLLSKGTIGAGSQCRYHFRPCTIQWSLC